MDRPVIPWGSPYLLLLLAIGPLFRSVARSPYVHIPTYLLHRPNPAKQNKNTQSQHADPLACAAATPPATNVLPHATSPAMYPSTSAKNTPGL